MLSPLPRLPHLAALFTLALTIVTGAAEAQTITADTPAPVVAGTEVVGEAVTTGTTSAEAPQALRSEFKPLSLLSDSLWDRLGDNFEFSHTDNPRVDRQVEFLQAGLSSLRSNLKKASPYLFHIAEQLERAGIPLDIALLPLIESAFDPHAHSSQSAMGLWQFIPSTASYYGLAVEEHHDQRKDFLASTNAAIRYLSDLSRTFDGDWLLALAAYNTGPGNVSNAMKRAAKNGLEPTYWNLKLSKETSDYVPRLIAATKIISNPEDYGLALPPLADRRQIEAVAVGRRISLQQVAELTTVSFEEIHNLNPSLHQGLTPVDGPHRLILPVDTATQLLAELKNFKRLPLVTRESLVAPVSKQDTAASADDNVSTQPGLPDQHNHFVYQDYRFEIHKVKRGDTLWSLSRDAGVAVDTLRSWNNLAEDEPIREGENLFVAYHSQDPERAGLMNYRVAPSESLSTIAAKFDLQVSDIRRWNSSVRKKDYIQAGQLLRIPTYPSPGTYRP